jgi:DNA polymerase I-like protein with 3'-5' exonuclease and polymerase domains
MALIFWTAADQELIKKTFGKSLKAMRPNVPEHSFAVWVEGALAPVPGKGDVVVACGTKPLTTLQAEGVVPKGRKVTSMRETPIKRGEGTYLITFDPGVTNSEPELAQVMDWDVRLALRLMTTGSTAPVIGKYRYVNSFQDVIDRVEKKFAITGKPVDVACDTETDSFYPWYPDRDIVSIQFTVDAGSADVLYVGGQAMPVALDPNVCLFDQIKWLLTSPKVKLRGSNFKYDAIWIAVKWGIECTNFKFDNMLVGSLLDENRNNSLNNHSKIMTPLGGYDDYFNATRDKSQMASFVPDGEFLTYAGGDTDAAQQVADVLRDELLEDEPLANFYVTILHPAARAFEKIERRGIHVDLERFEVLRQDLGKVIDEGYKETLEALPNKMRQKYRDRIDEQLAANQSPMLPSILKEFFFTPSGLNLKPLVLTSGGKDKDPAKKQPSTAKSHLKMFGDNPEAKAMVAALTKADQAAKTRSTFVDGFLKHLRPDGLLHPTYFLAHADFEEAGDDEAGTDTGRLSAKNPAAQIIPKKTYWAKRIRECFIAAAGKRLLQADYIQGELKVVACVANEKSMIAAYEKGMDLHAVTGARLAKMKYEDFQAIKFSNDPWLDAPVDASVKTLAAKFKYMRDRAKPANFGLLYGMGAAGLQAYAWATYSLKLTLEEAEIMRHAFFELYKGLLDYHENQRKLVRMHEMVRSPLGRIRHLPMIRAWDQEIRSRAERQAINSPIQSTLSDLMLWSLALIEDAYPNDEIATVLMTHDSMMAYVDEDKVELRANQVAEIMATLPFKEVGWKPQLVFAAEAEAGPDLGHLEEVKLAA